MSKFFMQCSIMPTVYKSVDCAFDNFLIESALHSFEETFIEDNLQKIYRANPQYFTKMSFGEFLKSYVVDSNGRYIKPIHKNTWRQYLINNLNGHCFIDRSIYAICTESEYPV